VAADAAGYVELAARWAEQLDELEALRAGMRQRVRNSPLCDAPRFADDWLWLLTEAWRFQVSAGGVVQ
jgi:predicted O-linked N-acetylglucosamine transferase (SPINDLY family)